MATGGGNHWEMTSASYRSMYVGNTMCQGPKTIMLSTRVTRLGEFFENARNCPNFGQLLSIVKLYKYSYLKTIGWATFWAIFSQIHLVSLTPVSLF
jgi:hypothetical protein